MQVIADVNHSHICERDEALPFLQATGQPPRDHRERHSLIIAVQLPTLSAALSQLPHPSTSFPVSSAIPLKAYPVMGNCCVFVKVGALQYCACIVRIVVI